MKKIKRNKGITLIALIVTIIVLLILAGISIGALTGDNGILGQAKIAKTDTERKGIEEQINVMVIQSTNKRGNIDKEKLMEKLNTLPDGKEIVESDNKIYVLYPEYSFEIDLGTGDVTQPNIEISKDETPWELIGSGTESDPFLIESIEDLVAFSNSVNKGTTYYRGKYVKLVNTLNFNLPFSYCDPKTKVSETTTRVIEKDDNGTELKTFLTSGTGFNPIGELYGTFDGNKKEIQNIYINRPEEDEIGLFKIIGTNAIIKELGITGQIKGGNRVGGFAGLSGGKILYCYNKAKIIGNQFIGGLTGYHFSNSESLILHSYNIGDIEGKEHIGGIVYSSDGSLKNCYNAGNITSTSTVSCCNFGGIGMFANIENCYNVGNITAEKGSWIGGIVSAGNRVNIKNSYNTGRMLGKGDIGGILGFKQIDAEINIENCFYLKGTAPGGINGKDITGQAEPLEESEMPSVIEVVQNQIEVNGEMINAWKEDTNNINNGYPLLYWQ